MRYHDAGPQNRYAVEDFSASQPYNENTSNLLPRALHNVFYKWGIIDAYMHQQLPFGMFHSTVGDVATIQLGIRPGPMLSSGSILAAQANAIRENPNQDFFANTRPF